MCTAMGVVAMIKMFWRPMGCTWGYESTLIDTQAVLAPVLSVVGGGEKQVLLVGNNSLVVEAIGVVRKVFREQGEHHVMSEGGAVYTEKQIYDAAVVAPEQFYESVDHIDFFHDALVVAYVIRSLKVGGTLTILGVMSSEQQRSWVEMVCSMRSMVLLSIITIPAQGPQEEIGQSYIFDRVDEMNIIGKSTRCRECFLHALKKTQMVVTTFRHVKGAHMFPACSQASSTLFETT